MLGAASNLAPDLTLFAFPDSKHRNFLGSMPNLQLKNFLT
jgi:hypothetical protein